jgi:hypothetical protein
MCELICHKMKEISKEGCNFLSTEYLSGAAAVSTCPVRQHIYMSHSSDLNWLRHNNNIR